MTLKAVVKQWPLSLWFWLALAVAAPTIEWVALLDAIRSVESGGNAFAIRDNSGDRSYFPTSQTDAIAKAKQLLGLGHNIDMGLMQVNSIHLRRPGISVDTIFDAGVQSTLSQTIFNEFYTQARAIHGDNDTAVWYAVGAYNLGTRGTRVYNVPYISKVALKMGISPATIFGGAESVPRQGVTPPGNNAGRTPSVKPNLQIPGQWRAGDRVSLTSDATQSAAEDDADVASTILVLALVIVITFGLIVLLKVKLLWWLGKTIIKMAAKEGSKQMSKNRQTI